MSHPRPQVPLTEALAKLPRQQASKGFTAEVLQALDGRRPGRTSPAGRLIGVTATTLALASLLVLGYGYHRQQAAERAYRDQVEELRWRYQELLNEVATVRQEVTAPDTRLYLGGDERLDLVLDLSQIPTYQDSRQDRQDVRPAAWEQ